LFFGAAAENQENKKRKIKKRLTFFRFRAEVKQRPRRRFRSRAAGTPRAAEMSPKNCRSSCLVAFLINQSTLSKRPFRLSRRRHRDRRAE
jgi:hypothetical protein